VVEDTTVEALAAVLEGNPRGVLVARDELSAFVRAMDQYKDHKGTDRQFYLSAWSNSPVTVDRKNLDGAALPPEALRRGGGLHPARGPLRAHGEPPRARGRRVPGQVPLCLPRAYAKPLERRGDLLRGRLGRPEALR
jgi:hypothetical protein